MSKLTPLVNRYAAESEVLPEDSLQALEERLETLTKSRKELEASMRSIQKNRGRGDIYYERMDRWLKFTDLEAELIILVGLYKQRQENTATAQPKSKASLASGGAPRPLKGGR